MTATALSPFIASRPDGCDGLRLVRLPFVPEIQLYLADDEIVFHARVGVELGLEISPFWNNAWAGGQALARYVLDNPHLVAGRRVLDVAAGGGVAAIAAAKAGASSVTANDIDPYALVALAMNAEANDVTIAVNPDELLDGDGSPAEVILVGDAFYNPELAARMDGFLRRATARHAQVLVGDPGRGYLPDGRLEVLTRYRVSGLGAAPDAGLGEVCVLGARSGAPTSCR